MWRISFRHKDPVFEMQFLTWIHKESDELVRGDALERASRQIAYIGERLRTYSITEYRQALVQLLSEQEKQMMMIQVDLPFAARIINPPTVSDVPTSPQPFLALALAVTGGLFLGVSLALLVDALRHG